MKILKNKKILITTIFILIIIASICAFSVYYISIQNQSAITDFGGKRMEVMHKYINVLLGFDLDDLKNSTAKCDQYSEYIAYFSKDTRQMSIEDLKRAIALDASCSYDVNSDRYLVDNDLSSAISELVGFGATLKAPELASLAKKITDDWRQIELLSSEKTDILADQVDLEKQFWSAELGYKSANDSFSQRQSTFQNLNTKIEKGTDRIKEIDSERKRLITDEKDLWNIFKAKTGYVETSRNMATSTQDEDSN